MKIIRQKNYKSNNNYNKQLRDYHEDVKYNIKNTKCGVGESKYVDFLECVLT